MYLGVKYRYSPTVPIIMGTSRNRRSHKTALPHVSELTTVKPNENSVIESDIAKWRSFLDSQQVTSDQICRLEDTLRKHIENLHDSGLTPTEVWMVAVHRIALLNPETDQFLATTQNSMLSEDRSSDNVAVSKPRDMLIAVILAIASAIAIKIPALFGENPFAEQVPGEDISRFYFRNLSLFVLPILAAYCMWRTRPTLQAGICITMCFLFAAFIANIYPFSPFGSTEVLTGIHVPIFLWGAVGIAYIGGDWRSVRKRVEFILFSGEIFICYVLIALGGMTFTITAALLFAAIDVDIQGFIAYWLIPCGASGAVLIAAGIVNFKGSRFGTIAPVLARVFTPLFTILMLIFVGVIAITGNEIRADREILIVTDLLLVVVTGLVLYNVSAQNTDKPPGLLDAVQVVLIVTTLVVDLAMLWAIAGRISDFGWSPNKAAALAGNFILFVQLAGSAWFSCSRYFSSQRSSVLILRWHMAYLGILPIWAMILVTCFPPIFSFS